jgi:hypothetical protein
MLTAAVAELTDTFTGVAVPSSRTYADSTDTSRLREAAFWLISNWLVAETATAVVSCEILNVGKRAAPL